MTSDKNNTNGISGHDRVPIETHPHDVILSQGAARAAGLVRKVFLLDGPYAGHLIEIDEPGTWLTASFGDGADANYEIDDAYSPAVAEFRGFSQR